jgi:hypothetical protein
MIDAELSRFDWAKIPSYVGDSSSLPAALRGLVAAATAEEADTFRERIEFTILEVGTLSAACLPVAECLVAALVDMPADARLAALDLLVQIGTATSHETDAVDPTDCRSAVARGFRSYADGLKGMSSADEMISCIDLVAIAGAAELSLRPAALQALEGARAFAPLRHLLELIDNSVTDLSPEP